MSQLDSIEPADEDNNAANLQPVLFVYDKSSELNLCDMAETKVITALFDMLNTKDGENIDDDAIVDVIDFMKSKFSFADSLETSKFEDFLGLVKLKFHTETIENLLAAIELFEPSTNKFNATHFDDNKQIIMKCKNFSFQIQKDLFYLKLNQTIDDMYRHPDSYKNIDTNYVRLLNICSRSKLAFQNFCRRTANIMIENQYPERMQIFLDQLVFDCRVRQQSSDEFFKMYSEDLYFFIKIMNEGCSDSKSVDTELNPIVCNILLNLRHKDLTRFVILTTHHLQYRRLLKI